MEKKENGIGGNSFIVAGIIMMLIPMIFFIILGDINLLLKNCTLTFSSVDLGNGTMITCLELRFIYALSYFCILLGSILIILGLIKKITEKSFKKSR